MSATNITLPPPLNIHPPLINSATPWATTLKDLQRLHACPHTGAVTTRTSLLHGFAHDPAVHQHALYDTTAAAGAALSKGSSNASFNSLGYSPIPLAEYLSFIRTISDQLEQRSPTARTVVDKKDEKPRKGFIVSVTGTPDEVAECYRLVSAAQADTPRLPLALELNLSCPNIPGRPPPAYSGPALLEYIAWLADLDTTAVTTTPRIPVGIKTPPFTHSTEYTTLIGALIAASTPQGICPVSFITATNTLGSCLMLSSADGGATHEPVLPGTGIGGMAGTPLHPLALGNVATIRGLLDEHPAMLGHVRVIGVGGVCDAGGYGRMRSVGADVVGVGTGLGVKGVRVFEEIARDVKGGW